MNGDLISIIVPAYNVEQYVCSTLRSVLAQTYKSIEVICADDGSADKTYHKCLDSGIDKRIEEFVS